MLFIMLWDSTANKLPRKRSKHCWVIGGKLFNEKQFASRRYLKQFAVCATQVVKRLTANCLAWHDEAFEKTHSLVALVGKGLVFDQDLQELRKASAVLTPYAVTFRYPGDLPELTLEEAEQAYTLAEEVWEFIIIRLPLETHPREK